VVEKTGGRVVLSIIWGVRTYQCYQLLSAPQLITTDKSRRAVGGGDRGVWWSRRSRPACLRSGSEEVAYLRPVDFCSTQL